MTWEIENVLAEVGTLGVDFGIAEAPDGKIFLFTGCCRDLHANPASSGVDGIDPFIRTHCRLCGKTYEIPFNRSAKSDMYSGTSIRPLASRRTKKSQESYTLEWISQWTDVADISVEVEE